MFINKIFKRKTKEVAKEEIKEECGLKFCPMCVNNIDELLQIDSDEYILKENETLVRIDEEIYIYRNNEFELLKEPLSIIAKKNLDDKLERQIIDYVDQIRRIIMGSSLNAKGSISLLHYNFSIDDILNYGFEKFVKILQSDGSEFEVVKESETLYGCTFREIDRVDIKIKWQ